MTGDGSVRAAERAVRDLLHVAVFNHSMRVLALARHLGAREADLDGEALAVAALFHDAGTNGTDHGDQRFELEGADAAVRFLTSEGWPPERTRPVWEAIALHTSPGIAERFGPIARLLRTAVLIDLHRIDLPTPTPAELAATLEQHPRLDVDRVLPALVIAQALDGDRATKAPPSSWPGQLVADHLSSAGRRDDEDSTPARR